MTIVKVNNYGAELQAYATQHKLQLLGYDAELIDYVYYKNWNYKDSPMSAPLNDLSIKNKLLYWFKYRLINGAIENIFPVFNNNVRRRIKRFAAFHNANTKFSQKYISMDALYENIPNYDVYMTGSDQVWNPMAMSSIEPYFLTFAPEGRKKIAYAPSFGLNIIEEPLKEKYFKWLASFDAISVREENGLKIVKDLSGKDAKWVIDPTLLMKKNEWLSVAIEYPGMPERYVLIYQLTDSSAIEELARHIGIEKGLPIYRICKRAYCVKQTNGVVNILDAGPAEFISLIANADYVVTDSFHGTAFSINLKVNFYTVVSAGKKSNSRMESLLGLVGLLERLLKDDVEIANVDISSSIEYDNVHLLLEKARVDSEVFLRKALC